LENSPIIFKKGLFSKTLDPIKENPEHIENYRSVTINVYSLVASKFSINWFLI